jgi:hypothetical protein
VVISTHLAFFVPTLFGELFFRHVQFAGPVESASGGRFETFGETGNGFWNQSAGIFTAEAVLGLFAQFKPVAEKSFGMLIVIGPELVLFKTVQNLSRDFFRGPLFRLTSIGIVEVKEEMFSVVDQRIGLWEDNEEHLFPVTKHPLGFSFVETEKSFFSERGEIDSVPVSGTAERAVKDSSNGPWFAETRGNEVGQITDDKIGQRFV